MTSKCQENVVFWFLLLIRLCKRKVNYYRLPKDPEEHQRWIKAIPRDNIPDKHDTVVYAKHFPSNFKVVKVRGRERPQYPER